jgi:hypothetical protein
MAHAQQRLFWDPPDLNCTTWAARQAWGRPYTKGRPYLIYTFAQCVGRNNVSRLCS